MRGEVDTAKKDTVRDGASGKASVRARVRVRVRIRASVRVWVRVRMRARQIRGHLHLSPFCIGGKCEIISIPIHFLG